MSPARMRSGALELRLERKQRSMNLKRWDGPKPKGLA
jgi:hypothetical protein